MITVKMHSFSEDFQCLLILLNFINDLSSLLNIGRVIQININRALEENKSLFKKKIKGTALFA